jgi:hypothetical protein
MPVTIIRMIAHASETSAGEKHRLVLHLFLTNGSKAGPHRISAGASDDFSGQGHQAIPDTSDHPENKIRQRPRRFTAR